MVSFDLDHRDIVSRRGSGIIRLSTIKIVSCQTTHCLTLVCPLCTRAVPAHRLATTEQSVVMSCTRSTVACETIVGPSSVFPSSTPSFGVEKSCSGLFQPSKTSNCELDSRKSAVSLCELDTNPNIAMFQRRKFRF